MLLQFCDKCGRPLSEGCIARGEAVERKGELICSHCVNDEQSRAAVRAAEPDEDTTGALGHYEQAIWSCENCGIPVTALDLIEGRASRIDGQLRCARCVPVKTAAKPTEPKSAPPVEPKPAVRPRPVPARPSLPRAAAHKAVAPAPRQAHAAASEYVAEAQTEQKRPMLPIVMIAIVLPMFAISLYYAVSSQQKLNEVMAKQANEEPDNRRNTRPRELLNPGGDQPETNQPAANGHTGEPPASNQPDTSGPSKAGDTPPRPLSSEVVNDLIGIENDLAAPAIAKLQSKDLAEVWEGLINVGSRRLIAARPYVRALLRDHDDKTRALACRVSGMLTDKDALPTLSRMAEQDPDGNVRIEARKARDRMTGEATRELRDLTDKELQQMLDDIKRELDRRRESHD